MHRLCSAARLWVSGVLLLLVAGSGGCVIFTMPGQSHSGPLPQITAEQADLAQRLRKHVDVLAGVIGERNVWRYDMLEASARYIEKTLREMGYEPAAQVFEAQGVAVRNIEVTLPGTTHADQIVVVGAHYDSAIGCPGANDNGTGAAAVLEMARMLRDRKLPRTVRLVAFVNEEPPFFQTNLMGSRVYAHGCRQRGDTIVAMITPETIGYYSDARGSQHYPSVLGMLYPSTGNFITFVGNWRSRALLRHAGASFRRHTAFPSQGGAAPESIPGVGFSDHWSFWQEGYPGLMVTDTAMYRYPHYHTPQDTPEKVDYERTARVVEGLARVVEDLAQGE